MLISISIGIIGFTTFFLMYYTIAQFVPMRAKWWQFSTIALFLIIHYMLRSYAMNSGNLSLFHFMHNIALPSVTIAHVLWVFGEQIWKKILLYILLNVVTLVCDRLMMLLLLLNRGVVSDLPYLDPNSIDTLYGAVIFTLLISVVFGLLIWMSRSIKLRHFNLSFLMFPIFPAGIVMFITGAEDSYFVNNTLALLGVLFCFIAIVALMIILLEQDKKTVLQDELRETRYAMELEQSHYQEVEKRREELSKIRHDFNNHLASISQLIRTGNESSAQDMISALSKDIIETKENPYCNIPVVNAILIEKMQTCEDLGIGLAIDLHLPASLTIEQMHLCSIFGNLLDNAITACKQMQHTKNTPTIQLSSMINGDYLFIKATNPSNKPPKNPAPGRGYGSRILSDLAARYGGDYQTEYKDGVFSAVVSLLVDSA